MKTLKRWKSTEAVLNQKTPITKDLVTRQLLKSNQIGTSILFGIANEHNCFKIQFSVCIDKFEQCFQASIVKTQNDLESFKITWKVLTPLKNDRLKLSMVSGLLNIFSDKKHLTTWKRRKSTDSFVKQRLPMASICNYKKTTIWYTTKLVTNHLVTNHY